MKQMSQAKFNHIENLANQKGVIAAAAMDQRGSLLKSIAKQRGVSTEEITSQHMAEFKSAVTRILTPHATAILLDPEYGLEAAKTRAAGKGLLLAYEKSGYDNTSPGRMPILLDNWSPKQAVEFGANATKILLYYSPFEKTQVNEKKHEWVEKIGAECAAADIPFFLEFVGYDVNGGDGKDLAYAKQKPEVVLKSMEEFSKDRYQVDVLKVEIPVNAQFVEGAASFKGDGIAYTKAEALESYKACEAATSLPFIYLSAGVSDAEFRESLEWATEAGVNWNGVLCGRATWKEGIPVYAKEGLAAFEAWLENWGVKNIKALNEVIAKGAKPWWTKYGSKEEIKVA